MESSIREMTEALRPSIDNILDHDFLLAIRSGSLSPPELLRFAREYQIVSEFFPRNLCAAAALLPTDESRFFLIKNLWDEHGGGDSNRSHRTLYSHFLTALVKETKCGQAPTLPSTIEYVNQMYALCRTGQLATVIGALCFGVESYTAEQYRRCLEGLERYGFFSGSDLDFFRVHISHDPRHYGELLEVVSMLELAPAHVTSLKAGALEALRLELALWSGFSRDIRSEGRADSDIGL